MLSDACRLVLDEIHIPPAAKGGMVEYKRTLIISLLFKFYLKVRQGLNKMVNDFSRCLGFGYSGQGFGKNFLSLVWDNTLRVLEWVAD